MSKKKLYKNMPEEKLLGIKRKAYEQLKKKKAEIQFDRKYGNENLFDSKHLKFDELKNTIRNVEEVLNEKEKERPKEGNS